MQKDYTKIDEEIRKIKDPSGVEFVSYLDQNKIKAIESFIHTQISLSEQSLLERVENIIKEQKILSNETPTEKMNNRCCDSILESLKHLPQEEVKNK